MITVPSFFAAARVFSHSVCHSAAKEENDKTSADSAVTLRKIRLDRRIGRLFTKSPSFPL
jgi:hypothetical protein